MDDFNGAVDAAPQGDSAPADTGATETSFEPTSRGAVDRAFAALDAKEDAPAPKAQEAAPEQDAAEPIGDDTRERDEFGRFKAKETSPEGEQPVAEKAETPEKPVVPDDAPARFSPDAKAAWATAPEPVKAEIKRAITELEGGLAQYKERWEPLKDFADMAERSGTTLHDAFGRYVQMEQALRNNPAQGLEAVLGNMGLTPQQYAEYIMQTQGEAPDQQATMQDKIINDLTAKLSAMEQKFGTIEQTIEQQQMAQINQYIAAFEKDHPRVNELGTLIEKLISGNVATTLEEAYEMADRLNPAPAAATPQTDAQAVPAQPKIDPAQTRKGQLSISGAPSSGSNPMNKKPPGSNRAAVDNAFAALGIA